MFLGDGQRTIIERRDGEFRYRVTPVLWERQRVREAAEI